MLGPSTTVTWWQASSNVALSASVLVVCDDDVRWWLQHVAAHHSVEEGMVDESAAVALVDERERFGNLCDRVGARHARRAREVTPAAAR